MEVQNSPVAAWGLLQKYGFQIPKDALKYVKMLDINQKTNISSVWYIKGL